MGDNEPHLKCPECGRCTNSDIITHCEYCAVGLEPDEDYEGDE